jgi:RNA polymerase sigma-70 factor, ECF subfamily
MESDEELAARVRDGDSAAFETLVARYRDRLKADARRQLPAALRGRLSSADVVQDCLLAALRGIASFDDRGSGSFGRWIRAILEHKVRDEIRDHLGRARRSVNREVRPASTHDGVSVADRAPSPGSQVGHRESLALVAVALATLPELQQALLRLVHEGGMTVARAAEQLGRSPDAGRMLYARAVARLAQAIDPTRKPSS